MALATARPANTMIGAGALCVSASARGTWQTAILDTSNTATAQSAAELLRPLSVTSSNIAPIRVGAGVSRVVVRARYFEDDVNGTHAGIIRLYAVYGEPTSGSKQFADDGTIEVMRLDADSGAGLSLLRSSTLNIRTGELWRYTAPVTVSSSRLIDLHGAWYLLALLETKADHADIAIASVQVLVLN